MASWCPAPASCIINQINEPQLFACPLRQKESHRSIALKRNNDMSTAMDFDLLIKRRRIDMSFQNLHDGNIGALVEVLEKSEVLEELNLWSNFIALTDDKFTSALAQSRTLRVLSLGSNQIACEGAKRLAESIKVNQSLQEIHLGDNNMGDDGATSFADALKVNTTLQVVGIYGNNIGDQGAESLAPALRTNQSVRNLFLHENKIGNAGAKQLADILSENHTIEQIFLIGNRITDFCILSEIEKTLADTSGRKSRAAEQQALAAARQNDDSIAENADGEGSSDAAKDAEIASLKAELKKREEEMKAQEEEIAELKNILQNQINQKDEEIAGLKAVLERPPRAPSPDSSPNVMTALKKENVGLAPFSSAELVVPEIDARDDDQALTLHLVSSTE